MANHGVVTLLLIILHLSASFAQNQVYIVYFGEHSGEKMLHEIEETHHSYLLSVKGSIEEAKASLIYSYKNVINGFSALLTPDEAHKLSEMEGVISVFRSREYRPQTTRSWDFVNLLQGVANGEEFLHKASYGKDVIVGVVDTGIWPESQSFNDEGMEPIPKSWKGICQPGFAFNKSHCNRKLIGARYYQKGFEATHGPVDNSMDFLSPRDVAGHGTHTSSTVGGRRVPVGGFASGTASGGAPLVRLATYKTVWQNRNCPDGRALSNDIVAAFDDAIADGVDVISVSLGAEIATLDDGIPIGALPLGDKIATLDGIAIGSLLASKRNIVVACSAGNSGPDPSTVGNAHPWVITVAASSIDRVFPSPVLLGNGIKIEGQSVTRFKLEKMLPLVYAGDVEVPYTTTNISTGRCLHQTLSPKLVKGKIVLCLPEYADNVEKGVEVKRAGGAGVVVVTNVDGPPLQLFPHELPGTEIHLRDLTLILNYAKNSKNPVARIVPADTVLGYKPAPYMAEFSSRGPNPLEPNILKPDITAPGVNILAAWSEASLIDNQTVKYKIVSGTSMSCPHVAAAAAFLKAIHPNWSSATIRSALMTTARVHDSMGTHITDSNGNLANPFDYGSGHFQPAKAADPGLVYDATYTDYVLYLCSSGGFKECPNKAPVINLNYPSLAIYELKGTVTVLRTVTNVGPIKCAYNSTVEPPVGYSVEIIPKVLYFSQTGDKKNFTITIKAKTTKVKKNKYAFGWYMWSDGIHVVRSPLVVSSA